MAFIYFLSLKQHLGPLGYCAPPTSYETFWWIFFSTAGSKYKPWRLLTPFVWLGGIEIVHIAGLSKKWINQLDPQANQKWIWQTDPPTFKHLHGVCVLHAIRDTPSRGKLTH